MNNNYKKKGYSLKLKLFLFMMTLVVILIGMLIIILLSFGKSFEYNKNLKKTLDFQSEIFEKNIVRHYDSLVINGLNLSDDVTNTLTANFNNFNIDSLNNNSDDITKVSNLLFNILKQKLLQSHSSGAFIMLDATINTHLPHSTHSKCGLYMQTNGYKSNTTEVLLYRGNSEISKANGVMPHRKWKLEFDTDNFPDFESLSNESFVNHSCYTSDIFVLPGMDEKAQIICFPVYSEPNEKIGYCGFEISESFFKTFHAQPSEESQIICSLYMSDGSTYIDKDCFASGTNDGYFFKPQSKLTISDTIKNLKRFSGENEGYIGITKNVDITDTNKQFMVSVMIPQQQYKLQNTKNIVQMVSVSALLLFFSITFSLLFSRRFLSPLLKAISNVKETEKPKQNTNIPEIDDLIQFLDEEDKKHEQEKKLLNEKQQNLLKELNELESNQSNLEDQLLSVQKQLSEMSKFYKPTIDEDESRLFLEGIKTLTSREKQVFDLYAKGYSAPRIMKELNLTQNGLKYHNGNIYSKLGVNSKKQLLMYISSLSEQ